MQFAVPQLLCSGPQINWLAKINFPKLSGALKTEVRAEGAERENSSKGCRLKQNASLKQHPDTEQDD